MIDNIVKKGLVFAVILLFICLSITPSFAFDNVKKSSTPFSNGNTLYVGGNGTGNYTKIQDAINNATDGDTVFVHNGTYYENVFVDKTINLIGEDRDNTIIDGQERHDVIKLIADGIKISNFTIRRCEGEPLENYGAIKAIETNNHIITDNKICDNKDNGIFLEKSKNNVISGNYIVNNYMQGIYLKSSSENIISNNIVKNCDIWEIGAAIRIQIDKSTINIIENNFVINNHRGIVIDDGFCNDIINNTLDYNEHGLEIQGESNNVTYNEVAHSQIGVYFSGHSHNFANNFVTRAYTGIRLYSDNSKIVKNTIIYCDGDGIIIGGSFNSINDNIIKYVDHGIQVLKGFNNFINGNNISNSSLGIYLCHSSNIVMRNNSLQSNRFEVIGEEIFHFYHDIDTTNTFNGKPIYYYVEQSNLMFDASMSIGYLSLVSCKNISIKNLTFSYQKYGLLLVNSSNNNIINCSIYSNSIGIYLFKSRSNNIKDNTIFKNADGIKFFSSNDNTITCNNISLNYNGGINLSQSNFNNILFNNILLNWWSGIILEDSIKNNIIRNAINSNTEYGIYLKNSFSNKIKENNFIYNNQSALFENSFINRWIRNYWNETRTLPKSIFGKIKIGSIEIKWVNIDWHPAKEPYDI